MTPPEPAFAGLYDHEDEIAPAGRRREAPDWGGDDLFTSMPGRRRFERPAPAVDAADAGIEHLRRYYDEFLDRYGTARLVPLKELLDGELGLGGPAGYRASERAEIEPEEDRYRNRHPSPQVRPDQPDRYRRPEPLTKRLQRPPRRRHRLVR